MRARAATISLLLIAPVLCVTAWVETQRSGRLRGRATQLAEGQAAIPNTVVTNIRVTQPRNAEMVPIPAGTVEIGDNAGPPDEHPAFRYTSHAFLMDRTLVTIAQFAAFVKNTHYKTDAERYGSAGVLDEKQGAWVAVSGATWRRPTGPQRPAALGNHPVTQVSWFDANAFCAAYGMRLPTEFEWERAARMGQTPDGHVFRVGDSIERNGHYLINGWEGIFPLLNTGADGYRSTSPVGAFGTAPSGLTDMAGNVWEWTSSWYVPYGARQSRPADGQGERVSRGGSFLCSPKFCQGYQSSSCPPLGS